MLSSVVPFPKKPLFRLAYTDPSLSFKPLPYPSSLSDNRSDEDVVYNMRIIIFLLLSIGEIGRPLTLLVQPTRVEQNAQAESGNRCLKGNRLAAHQLVGEAVSALIVSKRVDIGGGSDHHVSRSPR
jgi:hypothetical protein